MYLKFLKSSKNLRNIFQTQHDYLRQFVNQISDILEATLSQENQHDSTICSQCSSNAHPEILQCGVVSIAPYHTHFVRNVCVIHICLLCCIVSSIGTVLFSDLHLCGRLGRTYLSNITNRKIIFAIHSNSKRNI